MLIAAIALLPSLWWGLVQTARTEGLMARAEMLTAALDTLGHRLSDAQSLAASQCEPVSLDDKVSSNKPSACRHQPRLHSGLSTSGY